MKRPCLKLSSIIDNFSNSACSVIGISPFAHLMQMPQTTSNSASLLVSIIGPPSSTNNTSREVWQWL